MKSKSHVLILGLNLVTLHYDLGPEALRPHATVTKPLTAAASLHHLVSSQS